MAINRSVGQHMVSVAEAQLARVAGDGCARHPHLNALLDAAGPHSGRDVSDAVHLLCSIHGRYPGLIELALQRCPKGETQEWLARASDAFERERLYLVRLTAAVGPMPSTPGAAESESSLVAARHALETLAMSERDGCALGAATAWSATGGRSAGCSTAPRRACGIDVPAPSLPDEASVIDVIERSAETPVERTGPGIRRRTIAAPAPRPARPARSPRRRPRRLLSRFRQLGWCS